MRHFAVVLCAYALSACFVPEAPPERPVHIEHEVEHGDRDPGHHDADHEKHDKGDHGGDHGDHGGDKH